MLTKDRWRQAIFLLTVAHEEVSHLGEACRGHLGSPKEASYKEVVWINPLLWVLEHQVVGVSLFFSQRNQGEYHLSC